MSKFENALNQFIENFSDSVTDTPSYQDVANWTHEWCEKHLVTDLHMQRLNELGECFTARKKEKSAADELAEALADLVDHVHRYAISTESVVTAMESEKAFAALRKYRGKE